MHTCIEEPLLVEVQGDPAGQAGIHSCCAFNLLLASESQLSRALGSDLTYAKNTFQYLSAPWICFPLPHCHCSNLGLLIAIVSKVVSMSPMSSFFSLSQILFWNDHYNFYFHCVTLLKNLQWFLIIVTIKLFLSLAFKAFQCLAPICFSCLISHSSPPISCSK